MPLTVEGDSLCTSARELSRFVWLVFAGGLLGGLGDQGCGPDSPLAYPGVTSFLLTDVRREENPALGAFSALISSPQCGAGVCVE